MIYKSIMLSQKQQIWGIWQSAKNFTHSKSMGILDYIKYCCSKNSFLEKIETWHVGLSCQYTHFMSFSSKSEHDTVADRATLRLPNSNGMGKKVGHETRYCREKLGKIDSNSLKLMLHYSIFICHM